MRETIPFYPFTTLDLQLEQDISRCSSRAAALVGSTLGRMLT